METVTYSDLNEQQKELLNSAEQVMENSYAPYSNFYVGAALLTQDNEIIIGTNFENAAIPATICAERACVLSANSKGKRTYKSLALISRGEGHDTKEPTTPCGICRQVLNEVSQISGNDIELILSTTQKDKIILTTLREIFPLSFGPLDLQINVEKYRK